MKQKLFKLGLISIFVGILSISVIVWAYEYFDYTVVKTPSDAQFDFPGNYTPPELTIDGVANEQEWIDAPVIAEYRDVTVKMYRGDEALFFFFDVLDDNLLTQGNANDDSVTRSDSIELYLDTLNNGGRTPQSDDYQFNFGIHNKTRIMQGSGSNWGNWNGLIDYEVKLNGTLNDGLDGNDIGYSVEVMVPYSQINIQKDSTIGISFGRVDKFGLGDTAQVDWDWYGWSWGGYLREPQIIDNYVSITADGTMYDRNDLPAPDTTMIGTVTNDITGLPIEGVKVTLQDDPSMTTITDIDGYYIFTDVDPENTYVFDLEHDDYFPSTVTYTRDELRASDGGSVVKNLTLIEKASAEMTHVTGQVKNIVEGFVEGATVSVSGTTISTTTASDGSFTIENIPASNGVKLEISKQGFATETIELAYEDVNMNDTTPLGVQNLSLAYNNQMSVGGARGINSFVIHVTRSLEGIRFLLTTDSRFEGPEGAILYLQGGVTGVDKGVGLRFGGDGVITFDKPANSIWHRNPTDSIHYEVVQNQDPETGASLFIEIPYAYMAMEDNKLMPFGLSAGSHAYEGGNLGWDGMGSPWGFVDPENFNLFARYNHRNVVYNAPNNNVKVTISGTVLPGTVVQIGSISTTASIFGTYTIAIDKPTEDVVLKARLNGFEWQDITIDHTLFDSALEKTLNIEMEERLNVLTGTVVDTNGLPVEGATITISNEDEILVTTTTDEDGVWLLDQIPTNKALRVDAEKQDMVSSFTTVSLSDLNGALSTVEVSDIMLSYGTLDIVGHVSNYLGDLEGVSIEVVGAKTTTSDSSGNFVLEAIGLGNLTINVTKDNYVSRTLTFTIDELVADMTLDLETIDLGFRYADLGGFATATTHAGFNGKVTRGIEGFEFVFTSARVFDADDILELYISTKEPTDTKDAGTYLFALKGDGSIAITDFDQEEITLNETKPASMTLDIERDGDVATLRFILPYAFFGQKGEGFEITQDEVIGIALAQYDAVTDSTLGWSYVKSGQSIVDDYNVNPNNPKDYVRLSYDNILYNAITNKTFNFDNYAMQFGIGSNGAVGIQNQSDRFFANVSRDEEGIIFNFVGLSNQYDENELILIYLDLDDVADGGWNNDYLYKVLGNGVLYGNEGAWWNALANSEFLVDEAGYTLEIDRSNGFAEVNLKIYYTELGIDATDTIGFAFRQARQLEPSHPDHQLYDPWHDSYYQAPVDAPYSRWFNHVVADFTGIDAANEAGFVRIGADGSLYRANSNVA